jgi:hypothetical protein
MRLQRWLVGSGLLLAVSVAGMAMAHAVPEVLRADASSAAVFPAVRLLPGESVHGSVTVPGAQVPARPYLQIDHVRTSCATCATEPPPLADILTLSFTAPTGETWTGTITQLEHRVDLPGGLMSKGNDRTYALVLSLPARAGNAYQDLAISGVLTWGGTDASGETRSLLGEHLTRPSVVGSGDNTLAVTGLDARLALGSALAMLVIGIACVVTGWPVHRRSRNP